MTANSVCPDDSVLEELVDGRLTADVAQNWIAHIDSCVDCQERLSTQVSVTKLETQLPSLRHAKGDTPHLRRAIDRVKLLRQSPPPQASQAADQQKPSLDVERERLADDGFELLGIIGRGGMGVVYRARDKSLDRIVAIKTLAPELASDPSARQRFLHEARAAASLTHPNVITVHSVRDESPQPYLVMEYVEGISLQQQLDRGGSISIDNVIRIGRQLCAALAAAHSAGVVHRDVKPGNILLNARTGRVLLGDFGLALAAKHSRLTRSGTILGTPAFMAPETIESADRADCRADLFSLGCVLYAVCSGDSPFQSDSLLGVLHRVSSINPPALSDQLPNVPRWLSAVVSRLLEKDPNERFASAVDVREALEKGVQSPKDVAALSANQETLPNVSSSPDETTKDRANRRRNSHVAILVGIAAPAVLVAGLGINLLNLSQGERTGGAAISRANASTESNPATGRNDSRAFSAEDDSNSKGDAFALTHDDGEILDTFDTLEDAIEHVAFGTTLQIRSNDTFNVDACFVEAGDVTIMAAPGFTPKLRFVPDPDEENEAMLIVEGRLSLVGLELQLPRRIDDDIYSLIGVHDQGFLRLADCRLVVEDGGYCLVSEAESSIEVDHCHLHSPRSTAIGLFENAGGSVLLHETWITGENAFEILDTSSHTLSLRSSRLVCDVAIRLDDGEGENEDFTRAAYVNDSLIFATQALVEADGEPLELLSAREAIEFRGHQNTFAGVLFPDAEQHQWQLWRDDLLEQDSRYIQNPFRIDAESVSNAIHRLAMPHFTFDG